MTGRVVPTQTDTSPVLTDAMLERFRERAPGYDRENRFFFEDFEELRASGYLTMAVPRELGGAGFTLAQTMQHAIGEMALALESIGPQLDRTADEWSQRVDYGAGWVVKIFAAKCNAVETAWRIVDRALDVARGFGIFRAGPFEQLFRDARLGRIHPANQMLAHELVAKLTLGIDPDESPRWG